LKAAGIEPVASPEAIREAADKARGVTVDESIFGYITGIVEGTRSSPDVSLGASPRASIGLLVASKTLAAMRGRDFVTPDDVKELAHPVLRHRLIVKAEAELEGISADRVVDGVLARVPVPR
jgi:MoxR-like ATPase